MDNEFADANRAYQAQGWFVARLSPKYPGWYEAFPGHFFKENTPGIDVAVDARGPNVQHPVAYVQTADRWHCLYYQECASMEEAQARAERAYTAWRNELC